MSSSNENIDDEANIDNLFEQVGHFGKYQLFAIVILSFVATFTSITAYSFVFTTAEPDFRCKLPQFDNDTYQVQSDYHQTLIDKYIPRKSDDSFDSCSILSFSNQSDSNSSLATKCSDYVFSKQYYTNTLVTNWKLVCDRESIKSTIVSVYFFGYFGNIAIGFLADAFGRKTIMYCLVLLTSLTTVIWAILVNIDSIPHTTNQVVYAIISFFVGVVCNTFFVGMVLVMELVGPKYRVVAANVFNYFYVVGELLTLVFGYIFKDYRAFHICIAVYFTVFVLLFWLVPESPRFLIITGRHQQAVTILKRIARANGRKLSEEAIMNLNSSSNKSTKRHNFIKELGKALKIGKFRLLLVITMLNWFANTFVYNGLSFNIGALSGNPYLNYIIGSAVETVAIASCMFVLEKMKRKIPYSIFLLGSGLCLISIAFVPPRLTQVITGLALGGKFFISFTANAFYIITAEIYPTEIRNTIVSFCFAQSNIGAVIAPYVQLLGSVYWFPLPYIIYGAVALLAAIPFVFFVPETKGKQFIDKVEDMRN